MNRKKSFIMYTDYQKHINRLSDEEAGKETMKITDTILKMNITIFIRLFLII